MNSDRLLAVEEPAPQPAQPGSLWDYPECRQAFLRFGERLLDIADFKVKAEQRTTGWATIGALVITVLVVLLVVVPVGILTSMGRMSPDAATFVFGVLVGAAFAFLRDFFPKVQ